MTQSLTQSERRPSLTASDDFAARVTDAAYRVALRHGLTGSAIDAELSIWDAIRQVVREERANSANGAASCPVP